MTTRIGKFCYRNRWWVLLTWIVAMVVGVLAIGPLMAGMENQNDIGDGMESAQGDEVLRSSSQSGDDVIALVENVAPQAPSTTQAVSDAINEIGNTAGVKEVAEPVVADDKRGLAISVTFNKLDDNADSATETAMENSVETVSERLRGLADDLPGATVRLGGEAVMDPQINDQVSSDLSKAEMYAFPITALVLIFVFGGLIAAGVPLLATLITVTGSFVVLLGFSFFVELDANVMTVVTMLGLALSIDYGLLLVARYREELAKIATWAPGATREVNAEDRYLALGRAWGTAGRTILFSALTVMVALTGLLFIGVPRIQALGAAGIATALVAIVAGLTFTAALLRICGRRIKPSKKEIKRVANPSSEHGFFSRLAGLTQRRPILVTVVAGGLLVVAATPLLFTTFKIPGLDGLPNSIESVHVANDLDKHYGTSTAPPISVVARTNPAALDDWAAQWGDNSGVSRVEPAEEVGPGLSIVSFGVPGDAQGDPARDLVLQMRADRPAGVDSWVTGDAAMIEDFMTKLQGELPLAFGVAAVAMMVLLFLMTGSLVVPIKAIIMSIISLGATFGVLVAVSDYGWLSGPLDTLTIGGISPLMMVMVFAFATALSMDYEVFLLGRIKENVDAGMPTDLAVRRGLQRSGRIITSAALLMLIVFAGFAAAAMYDIESIGLGLFVAILVDATIVRCLLVPATMTMLGKYNWWAPHWLQRIHRRFAMSEQEQEPIVMQPTVAAARESVRL